MEVEREGLTACSLCGFVGRLFSIKKSTQEKPVSENVGLLKKKNVQVFCARSEAAIVT